MGRIHKVSRQIACGANRLARFSTRIHFVRWSSTSKVWRTFVEGKKGQLCSAIAFGFALQKRIHVNLSWSPQDRTACFWINIFGLTLEARRACRGQSKHCRLASTTLLLMPACKSNGWSPFRLKTPHIKWKDAYVCREHVVGGRRQGCHPTIGDDVPARFRCKKVHCLTVGDLIFRDRYISTLTSTWTSHCRQWVGRFIREDAAIDGWQPVAPPCLCGHVQFWSRDWRTWHSLTK